MNKIYEDIQIAIANGEKLFALLIDPEKCDADKLEEYVEAINRWTPNLVLVGGSQLKMSMEETIKVLKERTTTRVVLFPGNAIQMTDKADGVLLLSLLSGRNAEFLIGQHVKVARNLKMSGMEVMPTGYVLVDGGKVSAVERVSNTKAMCVDDVDAIVDTAIAGELLGMKLIYLEAGSGANCAVNIDIIRQVREAIDIPLIVGGGIKTREQMLKAYNAGADMVVVGNALEDNPMDLSRFMTQG